MGWATGSSLVELTRDGMLMVRERVSLCDCRCGAGVQAAAMPLKDIVEWRLETSARVWSTLFKIFFSWAAAGGIIFAVLRYLRRTSEGGAIAGAVLIPFPVEALWLLHWIWGRKGFLYTTGRSDGQALEGRIDRGRIAPLRIALAPRWRAAIAPALPPRSESSGATVTMLEVSGGAIEPDEEPEPLPPGYEDPSAPTPGPGTPTASGSLASPASSVGYGYAGTGSNHNASFSSPSFAANPMRGAAAAVVTPGGVVAAAIRGAGAEISMSSGAMSPHHLQKLDKETMRDAIRGKHLEGETLFHLTRKRFYTLRLYESGTLWHTYREKCFCCTCLPAALRCCTFAVSPDAMTATTMATPATSLIIVCRSHALLLSSSIPPHCIALHRIPCSMCPTCALQACDPVVTSFSHVQFMRYIAIEAFGRTIGKLFKLSVIFAALACGIIGIIDALDTKTYLDVRAVSQPLLNFADRRHAVTAAGSEHTEALPRISSGFHYAFPLPLPLLVTFPLPFLLPFPLLPLLQYVYTALFFALVLAPLFWWFCT